LFYILLSLNFEPVLVMAPHGVLDGAGYAAAEDQEKHDAGDHHLA
jgi:hypothetical protein